MPRPQKGQKLTPSQDAVRGALRRARREAVASTPPLRRSAAPLSSESTTTTSTLPTMEGAPAKGGDPWSPAASNAPITRPYAARDRLSPRGSRSIPHSAIGRASSGSGGHGGFGRVTSSLQQQQQQPPLLLPSSPPPPGRALSALGPRAVGSPVRSPASHPPTFPSAFDGRTPMSPVGHGPDTFAAGVRTFTTPSRTFSSQAGFLHQPQQLTSISMAVAAAQETRIEGLAGDVLAGDGAASTRHRPLMPESIRDAVHMYLESTGRHDIVAAMLRAEKAAAPPAVNAATTATGASGNPYSHYSTTTGTPPRATVAGVAPGVGGEGNADVDTVLHSGGSAPLLRRNISTSELSSETAPNASAPSTVKCGSAVVSHEGLTCALPVAHSISQQQKQARQTESMSAELKRRRTAVKRSHELLKRGLLERNAAVHARVPADVVRGAAAGGLLSSHVLPTLYGFEEAVQPDLVLLCTATDEKLLLQYAQLGVPPPPQRVREYLVAQIKQPMWSAADVADTAFLPSPSNRTTGSVLYGTVNQLVEELTRVYIFPVATTPGHLLRAGQQFQDAFFRQYRLFMPSSVLLAKLIERFFVPFSLRHHPENFCAHGITVNAPGGGSSLRLARSQGETVRRTMGKRAAASAGAGVGDGHASPFPVPGPGVSGVGKRAPARGLDRCGTASDLARAAAAAATTAGSGDPFAPLHVGIRRTTSGTWVGDTAWPMSRSTSMDECMPSAQQQRHESASLGSSGGDAGPAARIAPPVELVTHYSRSGSLWLLIVEKVQTKVLTVILQWLTAHPSHFDADTIHSLLHFVELVCYSPCRFADCPSRFPQIAEFIKLNCYVVLHKLRAKVTERQRGHEWLAAAAAPVMMSGSSGLVLAPELAHDWAQPRPPRRQRPSTSLCSFALDERRKAFEEAIPPPLRRSHPTMHTWRSLVDTDAGEVQLPLFAVRRGGGRTDIGLSGFLLSESRLVNTAAAMHSTTAGGAGATAAAATALERGAELRPPSVANPRSRNESPGSQQRQVMRDCTRTAAMERARRALELFSRFTLEEYVKGLTAAHHTLFSLFPAPDLLVAALHATASFQTSESFRQSFLCVFLRSSTELTEWATSLLLHAALLDGEYLAARQPSVAPVSLNGSIAQVGGVAASSAAAAADALHANASVFSSVFGDDGTSRLRYLLAGTEAGGGGGRAMGILTDADEGDGDDPDGNRCSSINGFSFNTLTGLLENTGRGTGTEGDDDGEGRVNETATASGATATAAAAASIRRLLGGPVTGAAAPAKRFLQVLDRVVDLVVGFLRVNNLHASYSIFRGLGHPFITRLMHHPAIVVHMDPHTSRQLRQLRRFYARSEHMARRVHRPGTAVPGMGWGGQQTPSPDAATGRTFAEDGNDPGLADAHQDMTLGDYMRTLTDSAEFPTIPAVLYYLRELQRIHATEPTFLTKLMDEVYPRGTHHRHRDESAGENGSIITPVCLVHWRKLRMVDEVIQTVSALQTAALYYASSRATVVRFASVNIELEKAFAEQLDHTIVNDLTAQQQMANRLLAMLSAWNPMR